jgi:hypothetical protein
VLIINPSVCGVFFKHVDEYQLYKLIEASREPDILFIVPHKLIPDNFVEKI